MTQDQAQGAGDPSDSQEIDPSQLSDEELRAFFSGDEVSEETPDVETEVDSENVNEETEAEAGNTAEEAEAEESEEAKLAKMRVRPKDDKDQQILDLYKSEGWNKSLAEAAAVIHGETAPAETPKEAPPAETQGEDSLEGQLAKLKSEVAELEGEAKEAADDLDTAKAFELQQKIMDNRIQQIRLEQEVTKNKEREDAEVYETYRQKAVASRDVALKRYPALQNPESVERKLFDSFVQEKQADPDYASVFDSPRWVELMANEFANTHNLQQEAPNLEDLNRPPKSNTRVLTSADGNTSSNKPKGRITAQGVRDNMHRLDRDTLYSMLGEG